MLLKINALLAVAALAAPLTSAQDCGSGAAAATIYAASYTTGQIHTLKFENGALTNVTATKDCGPGGSWLEIDSAKRLLYCSNENAAENNLLQFKIGADGSLTKSFAGTVVAGGVSTQLLKDTSAIAIANYGPIPGVSVVPISDTGFGEAVFDNLTTKAGSNVVPERQNRPFAHQVLTDPTGKFILNVDLGADKIRVYQFNAETKVLVQLSETSSTGGPRHAAFWTPGKALSAFNAADNDKLFYTVISELGNTLTTFSFDTATGALSKTGEPITTFGDVAIPTGAVASEVQISPDGRFLIAANRLDKGFLIPNFDPTNSTQLQSDTLSVFELGAGGIVTFKQRFAAGGVNPRHFSLNKAGDLVAVGFMAKGGLVLLKRDVETGLLGEPAARIADISDPAFVAFDDQQVAPPAKRFRFARN